MDPYRQLKTPCATLVVWLLASALAHAADNYMQGTTWSDPDDWSLHSPPANGDNAFITGSSPGDLTVLFDYHYTPPGLGSLTVDNTGGGSMALSVPANSLVATVGCVGKAGQGAILQTGGTVSLSSQLLLGENAGSSGRYELSLGQLTAGSLVVGSAGSGTFVQTGGSVSSASDLILGRFSGSSGRYELSGGTLAPDRVRLADGGTGTLVISGSSHLDVNRSMEIGASSGQGTVEQTGGTAVVRGRHVTLGTDIFTCTGTWDLSGGTYTMLGEPLYVYNGSFNVSGTGQFSGTSVNLKSTSTGVGDTVGNFNQSGGTVGIAEQLTIGSSDWAQKTPRYTLSHGTLTAAKAQVGGEGAGLFQQTGGSAEIANLSVAANGRYTMSGGSLTVANTWALSGQVDFLDGTATVAAGPGAAVNLSVGQVLNAAHATLSVLGTDSLVIFASGFNPNTQFAAFTNEGTTHYAGSTLYVAAGKTVKLAGDFNDHAVVQGTLTNQGQPVHLNNGVEVSGTGVVNLGGGALTVQDMVSNISGGQVTTHSGCIGKTGSARFVQTGGAVSLSGQLLMGETAGSSGRYELSLGQLTAGSLVVGSVGGGTFVQTGGSVSSASDLILGRFSGSSGRYELSGGTLAPDRVRLADGGTGTLVISGSGQLDVNRSMEIGASDGQGTVEQTGGTVVIRGRHLTLGTDIFTSAGTWNLSGGTHTMLGEPLYVYNGSYNVSGTGQFSGTNVNLRSSGDGFEATVGNFNQSGGTTAISEQLTIGSSDWAEKTPRYTLSDGTLTAAKALVGGEGAGLLQQTGGSADIADLSVAANGRYEMFGGSLSAAKLTNGGQFAFGGGGITAPTFINTGTATLSGMGTRAIAGNVANAGAITVHTAASFDGVFTNTGTLDTDAVALTFDNLLLGPAGYVHSAAGAVYSVSGDFINHSVAADAWETAGADLQLVGSGSHLLALAGADRGVHGYSDNFAWRSLVLGTGGSLELQDGNATPGAALYVGRFILSDGLSQIAQIHGHGFDIYYDPVQPDNIYLGGRTYDLPDGGKLIPTAVPEPATIWGLLTFLGGMAALAGRRL